MFDHWTVKFHLWHEIHLGNIWFKIYVKMKVTGSWWKIEVTGANMSLQKGFVLNLIFRCNFKVKLEKTTKFCLFLFKIGSPLFSLKRIIQYHAVITKWYRILNLRILNPFEQLYTPEFRHLIQPLVEHLLQPWRRRSQKLLATVPFCR